MPIPVRSIRLEKRTSKSLDTLSGASGEIFFDADQNTLRIYTANQADSIVLADRTWVQNNTFDGDYNNLTNQPTLVTNYSQLAGTPNLATVATTGSYNDLVDAPDLSAIDVDLTTIDAIGDVDTTTNPLEVGQLLEWDGTNWVNTTIEGFTDTNTTYALSNAAVTGGANVVLTDVDGLTSTATIVGGTNITVGININGQIEVSAAQPSVSDLSDTSITTPQDGQLLGYSSGQWINVAAPQAQGGIELTDLSATNATASGGGSLAYDNTLGVFTFTPPDLSTYATTSSFSVTTSTASGGGSLTYSNGTFTFRPANVADLIALTDLSVVTNAASGGGALSYSNTTGQFTYTPPDLTAAGGDLIDDTTPQLGGDLDLNTNNITGAGNINISGAGTFTGQVSADTFASTSTAAPVITSASTITLTAPDGIIHNGFTTLNVTSEVVSPKSGAFLTVAHDLDLEGSVFYHNSMNGDFTVNFTNVPTTAGRTTSVVLILSQSPTAYLPTAVEIDGAAQPIFWQGGSAPSGTADGIDVVSFTLIRTPNTPVSWIVIGSATSYS